MPFLMGNIVTGSVDCGGSYLREDHKNGNGFDILEVAVWGHFISETNPKFASAAIETRSWDEGVCTANVPDNCHVEEEHEEEEHQDQDHSEDSSHSTDEGGSWEADNHEE
mmetsp:Transcript_21328/g.30099  ORF Transcript_21328/g.30099 Transcript_21328/m.30099 type:complete len:110 (-) Transcript_21328:133-462(-)